MANLSLVFYELVNTKQVRPRVILYRIGRDNFDAVTQLSCAAENGHLEVLKWPHSTFKLTGEDMKMRDNCVSQWSLENRYFQVVKWLYSIFNFAIY
jgi:hypothetical protein